MRKVTLSPYITFNGRCREALTFYHDALGGVLSMTTVESSPMADQWPAAVQKNILHGSLEGPGFTLLASDMAHENCKTGGSVSLALQCMSEAHLSRCFKQLAVNGHEVHVPHRFYAGTIAALTDQFGIHWLLKSE